MRTPQPGARLHAACAADPAPSGLHRTRCGCGADRRGPRTVPTPPPGARLHAACAATTLHPAVATAPGDEPRTVPARPSPVGLRARCGLLRTHRADAVTRCDVPRSVRRNSTHRATNTAPAREPRTCGRRHPVRRSTLRCDATAPHRATNTAPAGEPRTVRTASPVRRSTPGATQQHRTEPPTRLPLANPARADGVTRCDVPRRCDATAPHRATDPAPAGEPAPCRAESAAPAGEARTVQCGARPAAPAREPRTVRGWLGGAAGRRGAPRPRSLRPEAGALVPARPPAYRDGRRTAAPRLPGRALDDPTTR